MKIETSGQAVGEAVSVEGMGLALEPDEAKVWIVVVANGSQVFWARDNLVEKGFEVYLPVQLHTRRNGATEMRPFLDRYFFVRVSREVSAWRSIFSVRGVAGVLGVRNGHAFGVKDSFVDGIRAREEAGFIKLGLVEDLAPRSFARGQEVKYGTLDALFVQNDGRRRGWIVISMFGKDHKNLVDLRDLAAKE